jgi:hypothetical protein
MAAVEYRLRRLEGKIAPPTARAVAGMDLFLRMANHARAELDHQDRVASHDAGGRLEVGAVPPPLVLSIDECSEMLANSLAFLDYLDGQRVLNPGVDVEAIDRAERMMREGIAEWKARLERVDNDT